MKKGTGGVDGGDGGNGVVCSVEEEQRSNYKTMYIQL